MQRPDDPSTLPAKLEDEAYAWAVRFISGDAGPDDIQALKEWSAKSPARAAAFDEASKVWQATGAAVQQLAAAGGCGIPARNGIARVPGRQKTVSRRAVLGGALAASAAGIAVLAAHPPLGLWPSWSELTADYRTETGQQRRITLPGDVAIEMNTRTSIALRSAGQNGGRFELIAGEAVISAPPPAAGAITVLAADGRIVAADARFNLRSEGRSVRVTCISGEIRVECGAARMQLPAGRQVIYSDRGLGQPTSVDPATVTAWQDGIVIFQATPIAEVIEEINRYRSGRVILLDAALGRERFSARFRIANIDHVVEQLAQVFGARVRTLPGGIVLLG
jgi:transmembrane sensor